MSWYTVIKRIKRIPYRYLQRTWREGTRVRTESVYLGRADGGGRIQITSEDPEGAQRVEIKVNTTKNIAFHGARQGFKGDPRAGEGGNLGEGFYLTSRERAERFRIHDPKTATNYWDQNIEPTYDGDVVAFDIGALKLYEVKGWKKWYDQGDELLGRGRHKSGGVVIDGIVTNEDLEQIRELLEREGFDGIRIKDKDKPEIVVFPCSLKKLKQV